MIIREEVFFDQNRLDVWNLLILPEKTAQYMFGCKIETDWQIGSPVYWRGVDGNGDEIIYVKGNVLKYEEGRHLTISMFDPTKGWPDTLKNYVNLSYDLEEVENQTKLIITQGDFSGVVDAKSRFEESKKGWEMVIPLMQRTIQS